MKNATKSIVCASFDAELEARYHEAVKYAAMSLASMQEIPGLHANAEIKGYYHAAMECLVVAFDKFYSDVESDIRLQVKEITHSDAFFSF